MKTDFKFGDKVTHISHEGSYAVIVSADGYNATVYYSSTDTPRLPLRELKPYIDTSVSPITRVMDALGIKKDEPVDVYTKTHDEEDPYNPYMFDGESFVDNVGDFDLEVISDIILGGAYFKPHSSSIPLPQDGDTYYFVKPNSEIGNRPWGSCVGDYALKLMGNVFKTEVEAKCHVTEMLAKYREVM